MGLKDNKRIKKISFANCTPRQNSILQTIYRKIRLPDENFSMPKGYTNFEQEAVLPCNLN